MKLTRDAHEAVSQCDNGNMVICAVLDRIAASSRRTFTCLDDAHMIPLFYLDFVPHYYTPSPLPCRIPITPTFEIDYSCGGNCWSPLKLNIDGELIPSSHAYRHGKFTLARWSTLVRHRQRKYGRQTMIRYEVL